MKIIYHCYGGTHSSVTAAGIHLGLLPRDRLPEYSEILNQKLFDRRKKCDIGKIVPMGLDGQGNEIYIVGRRSRPKLLYNVAGGLSELLGVDRNNLMLVDVSSFVNSSMKAGGFMSRRMGLIRLGRPIVIWGTIRNYSRLVGLVGQVVSCIKSPPSSKNTDTIQIRSPEANY